VDGRDKLRAHGPGLAEDRSDHLAYARRVKLTETQLGHSRAQSAEGGQQPGEIAADLVVAIAEQQQQRLVRAALDKAREELQRGRVTPVHILDHQQGRCGRGDERWTEHTGEGAEEQRLFQADVIGGG
jgi:hypothetical protein